MLELDSQPAYYLYFTPIARSFPARLLPLPTLASFVPTLAASQKFLILDMQKLSPYNALLLVALKNRTQDPHRLL